MDFRLGFGPMSPEVITSICRYTATTNNPLMLISSRGIIIRQVVNAIPLQSRSATGVRVQRLYEEDSIAAVAIVPASGEESESSSNSEESGEEE